jgi:NAD(P)-dependent dehydrogenase (short-subunit alcohol dehydrogenase family)
VTARTVAVVTGAGSPTGIGIATARALACAGHRVLIVSTTDRIKDRAAELRAAGHEAHALVADLTSEPDIERLQEMGRNASKQSVHLTLLGKPSSAKGWRMQNNQPASAQDLPAKKFMTQDHSNALR